MRHEEYKGRAGLAEQLCGPNVSGLYPNARTLFTLSLVSSYQTERSALSRCLPSERGVALEGLCYGAASGGSVVSQ